MLLFTFSSEEPVLQLLEVYNVKQTHQRKEGCQGVYQRDTSVDSSEVALFTHFSLHHSCALTQEIQRHAVVFDSCVDTRGGCGSHHKDNGQQEEVEEDSHQLLLGCVQ